ncbi:Fe2OG dioxygenase domain-containing protein [Heracleum sosnowskyi]|uniref:Fe2OG dioxygenase domain-containing protein n=1 Tax=Heracleum sosnowskyi TaxID=360622 RepID=A0AAD8HY48_9APIA|nr:Fe2OG dioxygenase domain-containing protein [Heracleum sosnowskyi]
MESSAEEVNFGRSLIVPSVQELAKQPLIKIPPRYVHHDDHHEDSSHYESKLPFPSVPIIDLHNFIYGDSLYDNELEKLHQACQQWGFFQVVNHGLSATLLEDLKREIVDFFRLPLEEKKKLWQQPDNHEGFGQLFVVSEEQKLDWSDMFYITTLPTSLRKTHLFDNIPPILREKLEVYSLEAKKLAIQILGHIAKALEMDGQEMIELFSDGVQSMRMNYYPPCPEPERAIGFTPHSDADALTILFQLNETEGLEIRKDGRWVPVKPLPNAFVVNIGDILEIVSNGVYRSIEHRATVNSAKERLSIATFYSSNLDSQLGPANSLVGPDRPAVFRRVPIDKYFKEFFARKLDGKAYLDFMKFEVKGEQLEHPLSID